MTNIGLINMITYARSRTETYLRYQSVYGHQTWNKANYLVFICLLRKFSAFNVTFTSSIGRNNLVGVSENIPGPFRRGVLSHLHRHPQTRKHISRCDILHAQIIFLTTRFYDILSVFGQDMCLLSCYY